jgi:hypothetical protein
LRPDIACFCRAAESAFRLADLKQMMIDYKEMSLEATRRAPKHGHRAAHPAFLASRMMEIANASGLALRLWGRRQLGQKADHRDQKAKEHDLFHVPQILR